MNNDIKTNVISMGTLDLVSVSLNLFKFALVAWLTLKHAFYSVGITKQAGIISFSQDFLFFFSFF